MDDAPGLEPLDGAPAPEPDAGDASVPAPADDGVAATGQSEAGDEDGAEGQAEVGAEDGGEARDPLRFNNWMKRSAAGAVMTGIAVGLQQALELPRQQPAFVIEASGEPEDPDRPIDLRFDPDSPADTVAIIRRPAPVDRPEGPSASS
ncbi:MAG TPA: hypothetical protein VII46_01865 [Acidimicrobiales bacterium]